MTDLVTTADIAVKYDRTRRTVQRWAQTIPEFPKPVRRGAMGTLFRLNEVERHMESKHA